MILWQMKKISKGYSKGLIVLCQKDYIEILEINWTIELWDTLKFPISDSVTGYELYLTSSFF